MPIAIITIRDDEEGNSIDITAEFEPALDNSDDAEHPFSALAALNAIMHIKDKLSGVVDETEQELASLREMLAMAGRLCMPDGRCILFDETGHMNGHVSPNGAR